MVYVYVVLFDFLSGVCYYLGINIRVACTSNTRFSIPLLHYLFFHAAPLYTLHKHTLSKQISLTERDGLYIGGKTKRSNNEDRRYATELLT